MKKNILVTGASSGFGLLVAHELHKRGYNVIGTSRNPEKIQSTVPFKIVALDITDDNSISSFGKKLFAEIDTLDVLINNAGFYLSGLAEETTIKREFKPLLEIKDNYPKYVVTMDRFWKDNINGIKHIHVADFLLLKEFV